MSAIAAELRMAAKRMRSYRGLTSDSHGVVNELHYALALENGAAEIERLAAKPEKVTVGWRVYCVERGKRLYCLVPGDTCDGDGHDGRFDCGCYTRKRSEAYLFATREDAEQEAALWGAGEVVRVTRKVRS